LELKELLPIDISKEKFDNPEKTRMLVQHLCKKERLVGKLFFQY
jgi:hypothetical protein